MTKLHELHGFLYTHAPDVVVLNETWLKKSIHDNEILPPNYKIFRLDRSLSTHPWDPTQPKKYRKNGGGVLIAHRCDLDIKNNKVKFFKAQAEPLSVMLRLSNGKNPCISTFYRVGTLRQENFNEFFNYFKSPKRKLIDTFLLGI